ncbi:hypothetical protein SAMN05421874_101438 [Nonomuraea maritima]|uniref:Uncharacterized protein n=1 Tax=Nonomuraea maritima TaxID=683260 RepID=A0A1G8SUP4_9ACTN|nr:hypothetical protein [Nonomuraea maritima]SDJ32300.1 hypothetical protein SAMN05421874_101438 [Nonomuraea maritima]
MIGRHSLELALPGASIGAVAGAVAGGLTLFAGAPTGMATLSALALAVPLAFFGGLYGVLLGHGVFRPGTFGPVGLYWMAAFPVSRLVQETLYGVGTADGVLTFLAYQAMVSLGFAIGFLWMHERLMPHWLMRRAADNPIAEQLLGTYLRYARLVSARKGARK